MRLRLLATALALVAACNGDKEKEEQEGFDASPESEFCTPGEDIPLDGGLTATFRTTLDGVTRCETHLMVTTSKYVGECEDCTFAFNLESGDAITCADANCKARPWWMSFDSSYAGDRNLFHWTYLYNVNYYDENYMYYGRYYYAEYSSDGSYFDLLLLTDDGRYFDEGLLHHSEMPATSLMLSHNSFDMTSDVSSIVEVICDYEHDVEGDLGCQDRRKEVDVWAIEVTEEMIGTEISIMVDLVDESDPLYWTDLRVVSPESCGVLDVGGHNRGSCTVGGNGAPDSACASGSFTPLVQGAWTIETGGNCHSADVGEDLSVTYTLRVQGGEPVLIEEGAIETDEWCDDGGTVVSAGTGCTAEQVHTLRVKGSY